MTLHLFGVDPGFADAPTGVALIRFDAPVPQPSESKRALAGNGAADKEQMIAAAKARFGRRLSEHEADACGHALAGEAKLRAMTIGRKAA